MMMTSAMKASAIGAKHVCADCAGKFYDLGRKDAVCPKCGGKPAGQQLKSDGRPPRKARRSSFGSLRGSGPAAPDAGTPAAEGEAGGEAGGEAAGEAAGEAGAEDAGEAGGEPDAEDKEEDKV